VIQGEGFTIDESKFDFFFGRVTSDSHNTNRSLQNLRDLRRLGIDEAQGGRERLLQLFHEGLSTTEIDRKENRFGITIIRQVEVIGTEAAGVIEISYFYSNGDLNATPKVTTIIPKIIQELL
jgi:hypothetical protein